MDLAKVLQQLRQDLANLDTAIASLERLEQAGGRRGRSTADETEALAELTSEAPKRRGRKPKVRVAAPGSDPDSPPSE